MVLVMNRKRIKNLRKKFDISDVCVRRMVSADIKPKMREMSSNKFDGSNIYIYIFVFAT
jgi:general stress protein 26